MVSKSLWENDWVLSNDLNGRLWPFLKYCSLFNIETGNCSIYLVADICLSVNLRILHFLFKSPIFFASSSLMFLYLSNWVTFTFSRVLILKCKLSTTTFLLNSSISFYFYSFNSFTISSPEIKTVLKYS